MRKLATIALLLLIAGCGRMPTTETGTADITSEVNARGDVTRIVDKEAGVVCWVFYQGGVSCLPIEQTRLAE